jgi:hypothetical protein
LYLLEVLPVPDLAGTFLARAARDLSAKRRTDCDVQARWMLRAKIDAEVGRRYGLSREQYKHVLGSFSHRSYPDAPGLCLEAFDQASNIGLRHQVLADGG